MSDESNHSVLDSEVLLNASTVMNQLQHNSGSNDLTIHKAISFPSDEEKKSSITTSTTPSTFFCNPSDENNSSPAYKPNLHLHPSHAETRYFRVVFRGVVALVRNPDSHSAKTGAYVSYGEIIASHHVVEVEEMETVVSVSTQTQPVEEATELYAESPPQSLVSHPTSSVSSLETWRTLSSIVSKVGSSIPAPLPQRRPVIKQAVLVDRVLTGGYAMDTDAETLEIAQLHTPKRSNTHLPTLWTSPLPFPESISEDEHRVQEGLGYILSKKQDIAILEKIETPPSIQSGKFWYKIVSSTPIHIFAGPCLDSPITKAVLLPGTIHEICLRFSMDENVSFLRLAHRKGWIPDRKVSVHDGVIKIGFTPALTEFVQGEDSISIASSASPGLLLRRRHRPPRRAQNLNISAYSKGENSTSDQSIAFIGNSQSQHNLTTFSNTSLLSEDEVSSRLATPDRSSLRNHAQELHNEVKQTFFLMRVNAPRGLKILDALQFQVSNLIHGNQNKQISTHRNDHPKSIFSTMAISHTTQSTTKVGNPTTLDSAKKQRILPKGSIFEASRRMEQSGSYSQGAGLVKLSDQSGWAILPSQDELNTQYLRYHGGVSGTKEGEATRAIGEIGNAMIYTNDESDCIWVRVVARQGVTIECPTPLSANLHDRDLSPSSSVGNSSSGGASNYGMLSSQDSDIVSSVGSAVLDSMFRKRKTNRPIDSQSHDSTRKPTNSLNAPSELGTMHSQLTVVCGTFFQINKWEEHEDTLAIKSVSKEYVRIRGGKGWVPRFVFGKPAIHRISPPETKSGSFWFRVTAPKGIKVRLGPSRKAPSIKSENGIYFRFECGEFLRACELVSFSYDRDSPDCFAKLYRNRHIKYHKYPTELRPLQSMTTPAEWVLVLSEDYTYMEMCSSEPLIQRNRFGWRYNVVGEKGVQVRKGPSLESEITDITLLQGESVMVIERVTPPGEKMVWLRLKNGAGWVHDADQDDRVVMIAHSLHDRVPSSNPGHESHDRKDVPFNDVVSRLFPTESVERINLSTQKNLKSESF